MSSAPETPAVEGEKMSSDLHLCRLKLSGGGDVIQLAPKSHTHEMCRLNSKDAFTSTYHHNTLGGETSKNYASGRTNILSGPAVGEPEEGSEVCNLPGRQR